MDEKSMKKSFSGLGLRFLIGTLIIYAVQIAVVGVVGMVKPEWLENTTINLILAVLPLYLIGMPVLIALVKQMPGGSTCEEKHNPRVVRCGVDHVLCIDVLRQPGGNADHYGSRRTEGLGSR